MDDLDAPRAASGAGTDAIPSANAAPSGPTSSTASPASKAPSQATTPTREETGAVVDERPAGPGVDDDPSADRLAETQPELEGRLAPFGGRESGPARLAGDDRPEHRVRPSPPAITVGIPAAAASSAASTLLRIPPRPSGLAAPSTASPAALPSSSSSAPGVPGARE